MLDLTLFAHRSFTAIMVAAAVLSASAFAHLALVSLWLQTVLGLSPIRAGLVALPLSLAAFTVSAVAGRFLHGGSPARPVGGGLALIGVGALLMTVVDAGSGPWALVPGLVVAGLGVGSGDARPRLGHPRRPAALARRGGQRRGEHLPPARPGRGARRPRDRVHRADRAMLLSSGA